MLGEKLGDTIGQITLMRVLEPQGGVPRVEATFQADGTILGLHVTDMGTYESTPRPDGTMLGHGQGIITTEDGDMASWVGQGLGRMLGPGQGTQWRGAIFYTTGSERLARLTGCACLFEFDVDGAGKTEARLYEWK